MAPFPDMPPVSTYPHLDRDGRARLIQATWQVATLFRDEENVLTAEQEKQARAVARQFGVALPLIITLIRNMWEGAIYDADRVQGAAYGADRPPAPTLVPRNESAAWLLDDLADLLFFWKGCKIAVVLIMVYKLVSCVF